jgi:hypothetical protein
VPAWRAGVSLRSDTGHESTRVAFESQPETKAWRNNVAGALTFFLLGNATVANGGPEPLDEVTQALFAAMSRRSTSRPTS